MSPETVTPPAAQTLEEKRALALRLMRARAERPARLPLSFAQERLWFLDRMDPGSAAYVMSWGLRITGELDEDALRRALTEIVRRHEVLRTVFTEDEEGPAQRILPAAPVDLAFEDVSALDADAREARVQAAAAEEAGTPMDLETGPIFRARLLRLAPEQHALLFALHHAAGDVWSMGVLVRELSALYDAFRAGGPTPLPELPTQYADYALWQRRRLSGEVLERQVDFWRAQLDGAPALLELPTDRPRPAVQGSAGATLTLRLPAELAAGLRALAQREEATLFMVMLAAFQALLARYSGQSDVVVGSPVAGRTRKEVEGLVGLFVNTLALRTDLSGDPTFRGLVAQVRDRTLGAYEHQEVPFEKVVEALGTERSLAYAPVFQTVFALQNAPGGGGAPGGVRFEGLAREDGEATAKFDLALHAVERAQGIRLELIYRTELFDAETAQRLLEHYRALLQQAVAHPERRLSALELLDEEERSALAASWSAADDAPAACAHTLFHAQAVRTPEAVALVHGDVSLTFAQVDARANRLARVLRAEGVGIESRVGLLLERSPALAEGILAALKAGGAYVPLDPAYPDDRVAYMCQDAGVQVVVTRAALRDRVPAGVRALVLEDEAERIAAEPAGRPDDGGVTPDGLAYVIYTSGSTGKPKGTEVPHRAIPGFVPAVDAEGVGPGHVFLQYSAISWDALTLELWPALLHGGTCVFREGEGAPTPAELGEAIRRHGVNTLWMSAAFFNLVVDTEPRALRGIRRLMVGGEAVSPAHVRRAYAALGDNVSIVNGYGPSECTVFATCHPVPRDLPEDAGSIPIGRPIGDRRVYLLDARLQPVPTGVPGELYVGGPAVGRGYLRRPALTAGTFLPDPFGPPGERMYRTGDRVRRRADGALEFLGRADQQVKVRGFRIEPGEVEAALLDHPAVRAAVALPRGAGEDRRLIAWAVPVEGAAPDPAELRRHLSGRLPAYMVPAAVVVLDALPLTGNGKLDHRALPDPEPVGDAESFVAPRTPAEELLAGVWSEVLGVPRIGVHDDFFALGGHSLRATRVITRVRDVCRVELPLRALFEAPTVAGLAARVEEARRGGVDADAPAPVRPAPRTGPLPLSFGQERMWYLDRLEPGSGAYNVSMARRLAGPLDVDAMERALGEVVRRHEVLRTTFSDEGGTLRQVIHPAGGFSVPVEDLSGLEDEAREAALAGRAAVHARAPFDLAAEPPFRATLLRLGAEEHALLLCLHHAASDGWSVGVLSREISVLYDAFARGEASPLAELPVQYADYAVWQREQLENGALKGQLDWWMEQLAGAPALLELPTDHPRPAVQGHRGGRCSLRLDAARLRALRALGRGEGATLYMVLLAGFQALLGRYSGQDDVVVGSPIAGRTRRETEGVVGLFLNALALRADLSGDPEFRALLAQVRERTLGAYEHQELPFERLVEALAPTRTPAHSPVFQVVVALQNTPVGGTALSGLRARRIGAAPDTTKTDLFLEGREQEDGLELELVYRADLFQARTAERMLRHLVALLDQAAADPARRLADFDLADGDHASALDGGPAPHPAATLHGMLEAQAARTPDAVAVADTEGEVTYARLDARANRLAHLLRARGIRPEARVGVCVERGIDLVVTCLGVMKAGGAVVPLDPANPADRLAQVLEDSGAALVVTHSRLRSLVRAAAAPTLALDEAAAELAAQPETAVAGGVRPENLAYLVYTSGSTGRPKGVLGTHGQAAGYVRAVVDAYGLLPCASVLQVATTAVDASLREIFGALSTGAKLVMLPHGPADPRVLLDRARAEQVEGIWAIVPSYLDAVVRTAEEMGRPYPHVRSLLLAGEPFPGALLARARRVFPNARVVSQYGPTETTLTATYHLPGDDPPEAGVLPLGRPIPGMRVHVLDARMRPVPAGLPGEAYLGGAGVCRGYAGRPDLSAERFVPDPFCAEPGGRLYRTGDRVRLRTDGTLEFLGRMDHQVKIRGFRVEPGEVEGVLREHPSVGQAVVVARRDTGEARLVAYVVAAPGAEAVVGELREHLQGRLPAHLVPAAFVVMEAFPLTPNGKLDRGRLPAPDGGRPELESEFVAPRDTVELLLARIWEECLDVRPVGVADDFFDLGGTSLLSVRLMARVRESFGVSVPLAVLIVGGTIEHMAAAVRRARSEQQAAVGVARVPLVHLQPGGTQNPLFCVHPGGGDVVGYINLARHLGADQPVYGLQDPDAPYEEGHVFRTVQESAALYVDAVRERRPHGPYRLMGWSYGGAIAVEMAHQLVQRGEEIELLAVLDTPALLPARVDVRPTDAERAAYWIRTLASRTGGGIPFDLAPLEEMDFDAQCAWLVEKLVPAGLVPPDMSAWQVRRHLRLQRARGDAQRSYTVPAYPGKITLLLAGVSARAADDHTRGWEQVSLQPVETHVVEGTRHREMMSEPHVARVAGILTGCLARRGTAA
jgi:amino acid adenylation domain-containing protein